MQFIENNPTLVIFILVIIIIIATAIIIYNLKNAQSKAKLKDVNVRYTNLESYPLAFKLDRASVVSRIDEKMKETVENHKDKFETINTSLGEILGQIETAQDLVQARKFRKANELIKDINAEIDNCEGEAKELLGVLDTILDNEKRIREEASRLKEDLLNIRKNIYNNPKELAYAQENFELRIDDLSENFSNFENAMYAQDYVLANNILGKITEDIKELKLIMNDTPSLISEVEERLIVNYERIKEKVKEINSETIYTKHLQLENKINEFKNDIKEIAYQIKVGNIFDLKDRINNLEEKELILLNNIKKEEDAYEEIVRSLEKIDTSLYELEKNFNYIDSIFVKEMEKFDLKKHQEALKEAYLNIKEIKKQLIDIDNSIKNKKEASSLTLQRISKIEADLNKYIEFVKQVKNEIDNAKDDEERANRELVKLQILVAEVRAKIKETNLPSISKDYDIDIKNAYVAIEELKSELRKVPLVSEGIKEKLNKGIDLIYVLYNNVSNITTMAKMVESTIVFANKYRSSYPEIETNLARAELLYLNGEYTKAADIAIKAINNLFEDSKDSAAILMKATNVK